MSETGQADLPLASAPVAETAPSPAPAVEATPSSTVPTPPVAAEPASDASVPAQVAAEPVAETKPAAPKPSLLDDQPPAETPSPEAKAEPAPAEAAPLPTYEKFNLPENFQVEEKTFGEFTKSLGEFERDAGVPHEKAAAFGQKLVDFYIGEQTKFVQAQQEQWRATNEQWQNDFLADKELGGNRKETTLSRAKEMISQYGGTKEQQSALKEVLTLTGAGNHPAVIRLLNNIGKALGEGKPVPAIVPKAPNVAPKSARRYQTPTINGAA